MFLMTHSNRDFNSEHTSWSEIMAFSEILTNTLDIKGNRYDHADFKDQDILQHINNLKADSIFVFTTGKIKDSIKNFINQHPQIKVFIVLQDPNWKTIIDLDRKYTLITPFKALENQSIKQVKQTFNQLLDNIEIDFSKVKNHIYLPFGNMIHESPYYQHILSKIRILHLDKTSNQIYIGSLKEDRSQQFKQLANECDFIGHFDEAKFKDLTNEDVDTKHFKGRHPTLSYIPFASTYDYQILMPDSKMIELDVSYIRQIELALIGSKIKLVLQKDESQISALNNTLNFTIHEKDLIFTPNIEKTIKHYGLMTDYLRKELKGVLTND